MEKLKLCVLVSGGGTNLQAIIDEIEAGKLPATITCVISNNKNAYALERAKKYNINNYCIQKKHFENICAYENELKRIINQHACDLIVQAGFLVVLSEGFVSFFENRIINIHASLIPSFCGKGFYGLNVHEAVLDKGCKITGATVHFVNSDIDGGPIILQKCVEVKYDDTPETLQKRVMVEAEHIILPLAIKLIAENKLIIENNKVRVVD